MYKRRLLINIFTIEYTYATLKMIHRIFTVELNKTKVIKQMIPVACARACAHACAFGDGVVPMVELHCVHFPYLLTQNLTPEAKHDATVASHPHK